MEGARLELGNEAQPSCRTRVKGCCGVKMLWGCWPPWYLEARLECLPMQVDVGSPGLTAQPK